MCQRLQTRVLEAVAPCARGVPPRVQARLRKELFEQKEAELEVTLVQRQQGQLGIAERLADFGREVEQLREAHEALATEDRSLERSFRRDFADAPDFLDGLVRLYKRRKTSSQAKPALGLAPPGTAKVGAADDPDRRAHNSKEQLGKPAASKASKGLGAGGALLAAAAVPREGGTPADEPECEARSTRDPFAVLDAPKAVQVIEPLDPAADMPEGLNFDVWNRLVEARGAKIQAEAYHICIYTLLYVASLCACCVCAELCADLCAACVPRVCRVQFEGRCRWMASSKCWRVFAAVHFKVPDSGYV